MENINHTVGIGKKSLWLKGGIAALLVLVLVSAGSPTLQPQVAQPNPVLLAGDDPKTGAGG